MDNTNNNLAKHELISMNEDLENYFRNSVIPQMFIDAHLTLRKFNPPAMNQFKLKNADLGRYINDLNISIRFPTIMDNIQEVFVNNLNIEKDIRTEDQKWYQMNIQPYVTQKTNQTNGVIITFVDITSRREIQDHNEKLIQDYENVIFALSHDLKGPVINIKSLIELLDNVEENDKEDARLLKESMKLSTDKLMKTIEDLTVNIKDRTGFAQISQRVNINSLFEDVRIGLSVKIARSKAKIHTDFQVKELNFSSKNIRSILYNLLCNALKFSEQLGEPEIWLKTQNRGEYVLLTVRDNGPGIEKIKREIIFLPRTKINQDIEGTGIGLYIVKRMVEDLGGKVEVDSTPGEGSIFLVYFKRR